MSKVCVPQSIGNPRRNWRGVVRDQSWAGEKVHAAAISEPRAFMPRLLADTAVTFVSIQGEGGIAGGGILNQGAEVVGLSNLTACLPIFPLPREAMKVLPAATTYASFVGIGTLGTAIVGIALFAESLSPILETVANAVGSHVIGHLHHSPHSKPRRRRWRTVNAIGKKGTLYQVAGRIQTRLA
jgi:hypothetical protein